MAKVLIINDREPWDENVQVKINAEVDLYQPSPGSFDLDMALQSHPEVEVIVATYNSLNSERLARLKKLKAIVLTTTAYEYVDVDYCRKHDIRLFNNSGYSQSAVAEHLLALMMAAARRIVILDDGLRRGDFNQFDQAAFEFNGKTLGIVGMGHIGQTFARLISGFGTRIIYYNRSPKTLPWQAVDLSSLARESDAIALAIPLSAQTKGMLDKSFFSQLKQGCILASISADEIIDKAAFEQALIARNIAAAGLDLHAPWPELQTHRQVVMTPVKGWYTKECMQRRMQSWVDTLNGYLAGDIQNAIV